MRRTTPPDAGEPFIAVTVDGTACRVYYQDGLPYWVSRALANGWVLCGTPLNACAAGSREARAAFVAECFLDGLRAALVPA